MCEVKHSYYLQSYHPAGVSIVTVSEVFSIFRKGSSRGGFLEGYSGFLLQWLWRKMLSCKNTHPCPHLLSRVLLLLQQHLPGHRHHGHHANGPAFTTVGHRTMRSSAPWDHMKERTQRGSIMQWFTGVLSNQQFQWLLFQIFLFQIYGMGKMFATMPFPALWQQTWYYLLFVDLDMMRLWA